MPGTRAPFWIAAALALAGLASADAPRIPPNVTIRGTGNTIVIERAPAQPQGPPAPADDLTVYGPIGQAVRMKQGGAGDELVIEFLRAHADELPSIIDASDVQRLRAAGLGKAAIQRLTAFAGVDIGWSWPGRSAPEVPAVLLAPPPEPYDYDGAFYAAAPFAPHSRGFHRRPGLAPHRAGPPAPMPLRTAPRSRTFEALPPAVRMRRFGD